MDWDPRLTALKAYVNKAGVDYTKPHFRIIAAWLTVDGNWDDVPDFARKWQSDKLGGATHVFGLALDPQGNRYDRAGFVLRNGGEKGFIGEPANGQWANALIGPSGYDWKATPGPYRWQKGPSSVAPGGAEEFVGAGLLYPPLPWQAGASGELDETLGGVHVTWFVVWQLTEPGSVEPDPDDPLPVGEWVNVEVDIAGVLFLPNVRVRKIA